MVAKKDRIMFVLPIIEVLIAIGIMIFAIFNHSFIHIIIASFFSWQCGWCLKSILETSKLKEGYLNIENSKFIEHWKVVYLLGFLFLSIGIGLFAFSLSSFVLGTLTLLFGFLAGTSFRITLE